MCTTTSMSFSMVVCYTILTWHGLPVQRGLTVVRPSQAVHEAIQYATDDVKNLLFLARLEFFCKNVFHAIFSTKRSHFYFPPQFHTQIVNYQFLNICRVLYVSVEQFSQFFRQWRTGHVQKQVAGEVSLTPGAVI